MTTLWRAQAQPRGSTRPLVRPRDAGKERPAGPGDAQGQGLRGPGRVCKSHKNFYIKVDNSFRGISESFKHQDFKASEARMHTSLTRSAPTKRTWSLSARSSPGVEPGPRRDHLRRGASLPHHGRLRKERLGLHRPRLPEESDSPRRCGPSTKALPRSLRNTRPASSTRPKSRSTRTGYPTSSTPP